MFNAEFYKVAVQLTQYVDWRAHISTKITYIQTFPSELPDSDQCEAAGQLDRVPTDRSLPIPQHSAPVQCPTP